MMSIFKTALLGVALCVSLQAETYVLDKRDYMLPMGTVIESKSVMKGLDHQVALVDEEGKIAMTRNSTTEEIVKAEMLSPSRIKRKVVKHDEVSEMVIAGQKFPDDPAEKGIEEMLLNFVKVGDVWQLEEKQDGFTEKQKEEVAEVLHELNLDESEYGYEPRTIGETWAVDAKVLSSQLRGYKVTGTLNITLLEVVEFRGHRCAKCKVEFDTEAKLDPPANGAMTLNGEVTVYRCLRYFSDIDLSGELELTVETEEDGMKYTSKGPLEVREQVKFGGRPFRK